MIRRFARRVKFYVLAVLLAAGVGAVATLATMDRSSKSSARNELLDQIPQEVLKHASAEDLAKITKK